MASDKGSFGTSCNYCTWDRRLKNPFERCNHNLDIAVGFAVECGSVELRDLRGVRQASQKCLKM